MNKQPINLNAILIGTGEFRFCEGFATRAAALGKPQVDFGNLTAVALQPKSTNKQIMGSFRGVRRPVRTVVNELQLMYQLKSNEFRADILRFFTFGNRGANYTQVVRTAAAADVIPTPVRDRWYDLTVGGVEVRNLTAVAITSTPAVVEDTNYVIDYENGSIRWITAPPGTITTIAVTAPAITTTDPLALKTNEPLVTPIRRGMGHLVLFDKIGAVTDVAYSHRDFYCEAWAEGSPNIDGTNEVETTININVLTPVGTVRTREE